MRCGAVVMLLATYACADVATAAARSTAAAALTSHATRFAFDGTDDEFEFDLDVASKEKLDRLHRNADGDNFIEPLLDGDTRKWTQPFDVSTKVIPSGFNYGRGTRYVTAKDVAEGEVLFLIPIVEVMNLESARMGRVKALLDANPDLPPTIGLALHLLEEKFRGESSRFHDLIDSFPSSAGINSTIFYSEAEMKMLQGSSLHRATVARIQGLNNFYDALVGPVTSLAIDPPLFSREEFSQENFAWAMGTVWARAFSPSGKEDDAMIAPILDTIGACVDSDCSSTRIEWDREFQRLIAYATRNYAPGEEVLFGFGNNKPSTLLMLNHGFARSQPHAEAETFDLSILLDPNDTLLSVKSHLLETHNMSIESSYTLRYKSKYLDSHMVRSLKLKLLSPAELDKFPTLLEANDESRYVSLRNEYVFTRAIVFACKNLLANYPTTLEQDRLSLSNLESRYRDRRPGVADTRLQILRALVIEKEILDHSMQLAIEHWTRLLTHPDPTVLGL